MDTLHAMKHDQKGTKHVHNENQVEGSHSSDSEKTDLEKHASHGAGYDLSGLPVEDGEYIVTAKTWAVVMVGQALKRLEEDDIISSRTSLRRVSGPGFVLRNFLLACPIFQHHSVHNGHRIRCTRPRNLDHIGLYGLWNNFLHGLWS